MFSIFHTYSLLIVSAASLLIAIQVPSFVDQYQKRVHAHWLEVSTNLQGFQRIADEFHQGSLDQLISKHERSIDPTFQKEAVPIRAMVERKRLFEREYQALQGSVWRSAWFLLTTADRPTIQETKAQFTPSIVLNSTAISFALVLTFGLVVLLDGLLRLIRWQFVGGSAPSY